MGIKNLINNKLNNSTEKPINPIDLFKTLNKEGKYGYLRDYQSTFLEEWFKKRNNKDTVGILNTGSGKTLIGLLALYSKMIENSEPSIYLCPNNQLVTQVIEQAELFNIPAITFDESSGDIPLDFLNANKILISSFDKLYNGQSVFGVLEYKEPTENIGAIVVDDAHASIERAREQSKITIKKSNNNRLYTEILEMFLDSLREQQIGKFNSISNGESSVVMKVPYWSWQLNLEKIEIIINKLFKSGDYGVLFSYNLLIDNLDKCQCFISGNRIEIVPHRVPIEKIPSFSEAKHRLFLSATFNEENNMSLVKDLGVSTNAIDNSIKIESSFDIGERMILQPEKYHTENNESLVRSYCKKLSKKENVVVLVNNSYQSSKWEEYGANIIEGTDIDNTVSNLKNGKNDKRLHVFINRYDGIDLPDEACRYLVIDGLPQGKSLEDTYIYQTQPDSNFLNSRIAQTIEQAFGRTVRSNTDWSTIICIGNPLLNFLGRNKYLKFFSKYTQAQISLSIELADSIDKKNSIREAWSEISTSINLINSRDHGWSDFYKYYISNYIDNYSESLITEYEINLIEKRALIKYEENNFFEAYEILNKELLNNDELKSFSNIAFYYELTAEIVHRFDKRISKNLQITANQYNKRLLKPINSKFEKNKNKSLSNSELAAKYISEFKSISDLNYHIEEIINDLKFDNDSSSKKFEKAVLNLGLLLGFESSRPEQYDDRGPDNLWRNPKITLVIECKNRKTNNDNISKDTLEQMWASSVWFEGNYYDEFQSIIFSRTNILEKTAPTELNFRIVTEAKLENIKEFVYKLKNNYFAQDEIQNLSIPSVMDKIFKDLNFSVDTFVDKYTEKLKKPR